jgi:hypothetical protein
MAGAAHHAPSSGKLAKEAIPVELTRVTYYFEGDHDLEMARVQLMLREQYGLRATKSDLMRTAWRLLTILDPDQLVELLTQEEAVC